MLVSQMMSLGSESAQRGYADEKLWRNHPMMWGNGANNGAFWVGSIFCLITWVAFLAVLISLSRYLWLKGNKEQKGK